MRLVPVQEVADAATYLYALLAEREPHQNISHKVMPAVDRHLSFVRSNPYSEWYLIAADNIIVGAIYLTKQNEVGIFIFRRHRGLGYGTRAVLMLAEKHKGKQILANIAPSNTSSRAMFEKLGFTLIQHTFERTEP